jgi:para-nitrobenzyl esterase
MKTSFTKFKKVMSVLAVVICCSLHAQQVVARDATVAEPKVRIAAGVVKGKSVEGVTIFKGIPYAAPPVGEYRWRAPQPVTAWQGELDATEFRANCAQAGWPRGSGAIAEGSSEDCLYLNLWLPSGTEQEAKLPVMVWIHGGGFVGGSGADRSSSGEEFARQGVILMTFNYRLGRLGHFAFPALSAENPDEPKGSYAYLDQIAALQWVKDNIAAFGGDPDNVTIFGESAGGVSVHSLLTIPLARGLFHKAILESAGSRDGVLTGRPIREENADPYYPVSAETIGINFARKHGITGTDAVALAKLRSLSVEEIVDGGMEVDEAQRALIYSGPILDGKLVVETSESAYNAGRQPNVPIIIGSNSAEVPGGFINADSKEGLLSLFGRFKDEAVKVYDPDGNTDFAKLMTMVTTDKVWAEPARFTANAFASKGTPAYIYLFSYVPAAMQERMPNGASHGSEIPYVFNNLNARWGIENITAEDKEVARLMNTYWVNFAKTGDPNGEGVPAWPRYNPQRNEILELRLNGTAVGAPDPKKARLDVIEKAIKEIDK